MCGEERPVEMCDDTRSIVCMLMVCCVLLGYLHDRIVIEGSDVEDTIDAIVYWLVVITVIFGGGGSGGSGGGRSGSNCWYYTRAIRTSADQLYRRTRTMYPMTKGGQRRRMQGYARIQTRRERWSLFRRYGGLYTARKCCFVVQNRT